MYSEFDLSVLCINESLSKPLIRYDDGHKKAEIKAEINHQPLRYTGEIILIKLFSYISTKCTSQSCVFVCLDLLMYICLPIKDKL